MERVKKSASEIQKILFDRIHALRPVKTDRASITVPLPEKRQPNGTGANWDMPALGGDAIGYVTDIRAVVAEARKEFELE